MKQLLIYARDHSEVDLDRLREAKALLELPYKVVPVAQEHGTIDGRVLAWGHRPDFLCSYALVSNQTPLDPLADAIEWALGEYDDPRVMTMLDVLAVIFGPGVTELDPALLEAEEHYAAYQEGRI